jgi:hypothetical protein
MAQLERAKADCEHDLPLVSALTEVVAVLDANTVPRQQQRLRLRANKSDGTVKKSGGCFYFFGMARFLAVVLVSLLMHLMQMSCFFLDAALHL